MKTDKKYIDDSVLIDLLEDDLDESLKKDLKILLENSPEDKHTYKSYKKIKNTLKSAKLELPENELYYEKLYKNTMERVQTTKPESTNVVHLHRLKPIAYATAAALVLASGLSLWISVGKEIRTLQPGKDLIFGSAQLEVLKRSAKNPDTISDSIVIIEDRNDLILNSAARHLNEMTDEEAKVAIENLSQ